MKVIKGDLTDPKIQREVEVLEQLKNPCIIRIRDKFIAQSKLFIIMEYAGGMIYIYICIYIY